MRLHKLPGIPRRYDSNHFIHLTDKPQVLLQSTRCVAGRLDACRGKEIDASLYSLITHYSHLSGGSPALAHNTLLLRHIA